MEAEVGAIDVDFDLEEDGRWIAAVESLPGVLAYGSTREEADAKVEALAQDVIEDYSQN